MKRLATLTFQYYRILLLYNVLFTFLWIFIFYFGFGVLNPISLFWAKFSGIASAVALHYYSARETYFYFRNAGRRMRWVLISAFLVDLCFFIICFSVIIIISHAVINVKGR